MRTVETPVLICGGGRLQASYDANSPTRSGNLPLIRLEPVLRAFAEQSPRAGIHFSHELLRFTQDATGVTSRVRSLDGGEEFEVRSQYLVGADRGRTVGPALDIALEGPTDLVDLVSTHFTADLSTHIDDDSPLIRWLINPEGGDGWRSAAAVTDPAATLASARARLLDRSSNGSDGRQDGPR